MRLDDDADDLARDFAARRPRALGRVYERYAILLVSVARGVLHDTAAAEDCVHDTLVRLWKERPAYVPERGALRAFLIACVRNEALSSARAQRRRALREERAARLEGVPSSEPVEIDPVAARTLREALARLPGEQRRALELAYYGGRSQREIAEEIGIPLGTVKGRIALALRKLSQELTRAQRMTS
jgi:RNA polymerase sigma-70 factor (ECF subfamily)